MEAVPGGDTPGLPRTDPVETEFALDGQGSAIAAARDVAVAFLVKARAEHGVPVSDRTVELTQLVVSELVTNARKYAPGPALLRLRLLPPVVEVAVWDSEPLLPQARAADPARIGQHGLEIVTAVARHVDIQREPVGKRIVVQLDLFDGAGGPGGAATGA
ncbi:ATP-binding protein [Streptomyces sp. NPDC008150]